MNRFRLKRILIGAMVALCLGLALSPLGIGSAKTTRSVPVQFRVWDGTHTNGLEWDTDLNGKTGVFELGSLGQSGDGRHIIAPGTGGSHVFTIQNVSKHEITYRCTISENNPHSIPLEIRLRTISGDYLAGTADTWIPIGDIDEYSSNITTSDTETLVLEWRWPFEVSDDHDVADTSLGVKAADATVPHDIMIAIQADDVVEEVPSSEPTPVSTTGQSQSGRSSHDVRSGDSAQIEVAVLVLLLSASSLCLLVRLSRKGAEHG